MSDTRTTSGRAEERADLPPMARARYRAAQSVRVAWYAGQSVLARRAQAALDLTPAPDTAPLDRARLRSSFASAFAVDRANVAAGLYDPPRDLDPLRALSAVDAARRFLADVPKVDARRRSAKGGVEVRGQAPAGAYPPYYRQNFHYQTDGWFSEQSARLYDTQVEVLFTGAADAMRRSALGLLAAAWRGRDQRGLKHLDVACGTGRFLGQVLTAYPRLEATGVDLSPAYCARARDQLKRFTRVTIEEANAERLPFADGAFDTVSCVYLFHELPPRVRAQVAQELARVLAPGGVLVVADALQTGDEPGVDALLAQFPALFHEPFFRSYLTDDLVARFAANGLERGEEVLSYLTKSTAYHRPAVARAGAPAP